MKSIILLIALLLLPAAFYAAGAQGLVIPDTIDFGICPVGVAEYPGTYDKNFFIKNESHENIFITHIGNDYNYPSYIRSLGNYFTMYDRVFEYGPEMMIQSGDSIKLSLWYYSKFPDEISKISYLKAGLTFKYHFENDLTTRYDTSEIHMRSLAIDSLFTSGAYYSTWRNCFKENQYFSLDMFIKIYNTTNNSYIIDSVNYQIKGVFEINGLYEELRKNSPIDLPYELKDSNVIFLYTKLLFPEYHENKLIANIFCRNKESGEKIKLTDSLVLIYNQPKSFFFQNGSSNLIAYQGDTLFNEGSLSIIGCAGDSTVIDSLSVMNDIGLNEYNIIPYNGDFPKVIATDTFTRIGSVQFIANEVGTTKSYVAAFCQDKNGNKFTRYTPISLTGLSPGTSVNAKENDDIKLIIFPNPANEFVKIYMNNQSSLFPATLSIYNSIGKKELNIDRFENYTKIPVNNLSNGIYFVVVNNKYHIYGGSFIISR